LVGAALVLAACGGASGGALDATATPQARDRPALRYRSVTEALDAIAERVRVPAVLPSNLPPGMELAMDPQFPRRGSAQLYLRGDGRNLIVEYGTATFDGCGPTEPQIVAVGDHPAVLQVHRRGKHPAATLIWPATLERLQGHYGLSGDFSGEQLLRFANSMAAAGAAQPKQRGGC